MHDNASVFKGNEDYEEDINLYKPMNYEEVTISKYKGRQINQSKEQITRWNYQNSNSAIEDYHSIIQTCLRFEIDK